jgi:hypothetical protein
MSELSYRRATIEDIALVTAAVVDAERSGTPRSLHERVFDLGQGELEALVDAMLREEVPGSELCCESFLLAVDGGEPVGAIATWIEEEDGPPSSFVRATLLGHAVGAERWAAARAKLAPLAAIDIPREPGTLQIEAVYVPAAHRGRRVVPRLIEHALGAYAASHPGVRKAQIQSALGNEPSRRAFLHAGFSIARETRTDRPEILAVFPGTGRILWERALPC